MNNKKYIIIVVLVLILAGAIFLVFRKKVNQPLKTIPSPTEQAAIKLEVEKKNIETMKSLDGALDKARLKDKDLDGLSDEQEKKLGTDPNNPDTDGDGLLDGDEVNFYHTNPLKADTDGDGYNDGYEVKHGYNPLGAGKLIK